MRKKTHTWIHSFEDIQKGTDPFWEKEVVAILNDLIEHEKQYLIFPFQSELAFTKKEKLADFIMNGCYLIVLYGKSANKVIGVNIVRTVSTGNSLVGVMGFLSIIKGERHKGYGTILLKESETFLKKLGCDAVNLNVIELNNVAKNFYAKHGYQPIQIQYAKNV